MNIGTKWWLEAQISGWMEGSTDRWVGGNSHMEEWLNKMMMDIQIGPTNHKYFYTYYA